MGSDRGRWFLIAEWLYRVPIDLGGVIALTVLTVLSVFLPTIQETPLRFIFGLPFILFLPGYAFIAVLFPEQSGQPSAKRVAESNRISLIERIALAFVMSTAIVPLIGLALTFTRWGIRLTPIVLSVSTFTIVCTIAAVIRRRELPPREQFSVPHRKWADRARTGLFMSNDQINPLNIALALSILLAVVSVGFAVAVPQVGEPFTEFYLLTEDEGKLVTDGYSEEFVQGEPSSMTVGIENQEYETVEYTVVVQLERIGGEVIEREELDRFHRTLEHEETWHAEHELTPTMTGENLRLSYLLYKGEPPEEPTKENSYRDLHLWITVENSDAEEPIEITDRNRPPNA